MAKDGTTVRTTQKIHSMMEVKIIKQVSNVVFTDTDQRDKHFASLFVNSWDTLQAYNQAFEDVQKVRASYMLQDPAIWELIFINLRKKEKRTIWENDIIKEYDRILEDYKLSPFELYLTFVHKGTKDDCLAVCLNIDCIIAYEILLNLYHFFTLLKRKIFYKNVKLRLKDEVNLIMMLERENEKAAVTKKLSKIIDVDDMDI